MVYLGNNTSGENKILMLIFLAGEMSFSVEYPGHKDIGQLLDGLIYSF